MNKEYAEYLLNKTTQDYNLIAEDFSSKRKEPWPEIKFLFDNYIIPGEKVLDLGCGNGRFSAFVKDKKADYFGTDASERLIAIAKRNYPGVSFQAADAFNLPFPSNFFNKVYIIAVLHHIPSKDKRLRFLDEAKRVLKPGGLLVLAVWEPHGLNESLLLLKYAIFKLLGLSKLDFGDVFEPWGKKTNRYYHLFSKKELISLLKEAGFRVLENGIVKNERGNRRNIYLVVQK
ncbi:MAG: class I SAM-dependent methyltransferase [Candidatus Nealsonbacteria bacterium]|nr:class I SAM-dependent methyltransferase [Candidatus Nealsonbacteria bacterium]